MNHSLVRRRALLLGVSVLLGAMSAPVAASGLNFLARGPMSRFNEADMKLLNGALSQALKAPEAGTPVEWANEKSAASGSVTLQRLFDRAGVPCRELKIVNRHRQLESSGVYTLCRRDGRWKLAQ
jgi:surface antigen